MSNGTKALLLTLSLSLLGTALARAGVIDKLDVIIGLLGGANFLLWVAYYDRQSAKKGDDQ